MRKMIKNDLAKHGLNKTWDNSKFGLIFERPNRRDGEGRGKERRKGRRREEEEENQRSHDQKGMELTLDMDHMNFVWNSRKVYEFQT